MTGIMEQFRPRFENVMIFLEGRNIYDVQDMLIDRSELEDLFREICDAAREAGLAQVSLNNRYHDVFGVSDWGLFVRSGEHEPFSSNLYPIRQHVADVVTDWFYDPDGEVARKFPDHGPRMGAAMAGATAHRTAVVRKEDVPRIVDLIISQITDPTPNMKDSPSRGFQSQLDGKEVFVKMNGWRPELVRMDGGSVRAVPAPEIRPAIQHHVLKTTGRVVIITGEGGAEFSKKMHAISTTKVGLRNDHGNYGSQKSMVEHRRLLRDMTGAISVPLGDHFPSFFAQDGLIIATDGEMPEGASLAEGSFENFWIIDQNDLLEVMLGRDRPEGRAEQMISRLERGVEGVAVIDVQPGEMHVYVPNGWRAEDFSEAVTPAAPAVDEGDIYMLISREPIDFGDVPVAEAPELVRENAPSGPEDNGCEPG